MDILKKVKDSASAVTDAVKDSASAVTEKFKDLKDEIWGDEKSSIIDEFKDKGIDKIKDTLNDLTNSEPILTKAGFKQTGFSIILGLPPEVKTSFELIRKISESERAEVLKEVENNKMMKLILTCLFKANDYCDKVQIGEHSVETIDIALGITPMVEIFLKK